MTVRASTAADVPRLHAIWRAAVLATHQFLSRPHFEEIEALVLDEYLPHAAFLVVERGGAVAGFMAVTDAHVDTLFVDPAAHGRGVGRMLIAWALAEHGRLTVDVSEQNPGAVRFYQRMGFVVVGRAATDDGGRPYPLLYMAMN